MEPKVLVAYSTKHGATAEIAERIGRLAGKAGYRIEVLSVERVVDVDLYEAVVLGSAVFYGRWRKNAADFLKANEKKLADRHVWLFSSGPAGQGDPAELLKGWRFPAELKTIVSRLKQSL